MTKTGRSSFTLALLGVSLLLNLVAATYFGQKLLRKNASSPTRPVERPEYYLDRNKLFEALPADSNAVVFLGNSLTQYFELAEFFPGKRVKNRGIHGDMLDKVLRRLGPVIRSKPEKIFIELGINDTEQNVSADSLIAMYRRMLDTLKQTTPSSKIYIQSLLPVSDSSKFSTYSYCSPEMNMRILDVNEKLKKLAAERTSTYVNLHPHFVAGKQLAPAYTVDGVHLSGEGYRLWAQMVAPFVYE